MLTTDQADALLFKRINVKGLDFDKDGVEIPKAELMQIPGLFMLKDVQDRIPISLKRLKYWYSNRTGPFRKCFAKVCMGEKRSLIYVDLQMLCSEFQGKLEKS